MCATCGDRCHPHASADCSLGVAPWILCPVSRAIRLLALLRDDLVLGLERHPRTVIVGRWWRPDHHAWELAELDGEPAVLAADRHGLVLVTLRFDHDVSRGAGRDQEVLG